MFLAKVLGVFAVLTVFSVLAVFAIFSIRLIIRSVIGSVIRLIIGSVIRSIVWLVIGFVIGFTVRLTVRISVRTTASIASRCRAIISLYRGFTTTAISWICESYCIGLFTFRRFNRTDCNDCSGRNLDIFLIFRFAGAMNKRGRVCVNRWGSDL